jgi:predicted KAP-like P-loop ATPase
MTTYHRKFTVKKPHQNTSISQKPLQKAQSSVRNKKTLKTVA